MREAAHDSEQGSGCTLAFARDQEWPQEHASTESAEQRAYQPWHAHRD